ncbi:hypothetical protein INT45_004802 [Circinella minor]|uniref:Uncharacterized protein n=1 Tax=Circinella minor TaxID=1195481 RepID=A0A8H7SFS7_9FUNG|nr:hypothetical protein INT45_004802 [Circinella minor]
MSYQKSNQAVETNKQASNQVVFDVRRDNGSKQIEASYYNDDDSSTIINDDSTIIHSKNVEEERQSSTTRSLETRPTDFIHSLNGRPVNADASSHEASKIDYLLFRR